MGPKRLLRRRLTDAELIARSGGDPAGFSELYTRHVADVYAWLSRRLAWAASDLTAETFARALLSRDRFRDDHDESALPWLLGIARNVLLETVRQDRIETRARERLGLPVDLATEDGFTAVEDRLSPRLALERWLDALPAGEREALQLRVIDELAYDQVAEIPLGERHRRVVRRPTSATTPSSPSTASSARAGQAGRPSRHATGLASVRTTSGRGFSRRYSIELTTSSSRRGGSESAT